jgi:hypothetical protein
MNAADEVKTLFLTADNHYLGAVNSYNASKKGLYHKYDPTNHILNFCELAGEIYLKAFLKYNGALYEHNHKMEILLEKCCRFNADFNSLDRECSLLVTFTSKIHYPNELHINESTLVKTIKAVEKIILFEPMLLIRKNLQIPLPIFDDAEKTFITP